MQHPCIGYFLDPKCEVKSATMITDIVCVCVWGGGGGGEGEGNYIWFPHTTKQV